MASLLRDAVLNVGYLAFPDLRTFGRKTDQVEKTTKSLRIATNEAIVRPKREA